MRFALAFVLLLVATTTSAQSIEEPIVGLPCKGCEAVFDGMPAQISSRARSAPKFEPGAAMVVEGSALNRDGKPEAGIIVYAYQTNSSGVYPQSSDVRDDETRRHGSLRAWIKTDAGRRCGARSD